MSDRPTVVEDEVPQPKTADDLMAELLEWNNATPPPGPIHLYSWPAEEPAEGEVYVTGCCGVSPRDLEADPQGGHSFTQDPSIVTCGV